MLKAARIGDSLHSQLRDLERDLTVLHGELEVRWLSFSPCLSVHGLSCLSTPFQDQRTQVALVQQKELPPLEKTLAALVEAEAECARCNVEDNEHANVTSEDLRWELDLFKTSLAKRVAFIDNQIVSRELTNVSRATYALSLTLCDSAELFGSRSRRRNWKSLRPPSGTSTRMARTRSPSRSSLRPSRAIPSFTQYVSCSASSRERKGRP